MKIRTRFAPSPTGLLHVGGVRTALFSWLYAKRHGGDFVLRIEDTDRVRSTQESVDAILQGMAWLGLNSDEGPYYQTERYERYRQVLDEMLDQGLAYRCDCSKARLEQLRETQLAHKIKPRYDGLCRDKDLSDEGRAHVIRFKNPTEGLVSFNDRVYGMINIDNAELDDLVLCRSDGNPTYNFTVVVDDWDMKISHVIRGDDHINNTPRQINLFKALGAEVPSYAHLPMILGDDGKRLSKRHGAVGVLEFRKQGILPQALLNYLVRLGWSHGDQEIFSMTQMQSLFDLAAVSRGVSSFNYEKLYWLNQHYLRTGGKAMIEPEVIWHCKRRQQAITEGPDLAAVIAVQGERCQTVTELLDKSQYFYQDEVEYDSNAVKKHLRPVILEPLMHLLKQFQQLTAWEKQSLEQVVIETAMHFDLKMGKIAQPLRVAVTGSSMSPAIDDTLALIGQNRVIARLIQAIELVRQRSDESA